MITAEDLNPHKFETTEEQKKNLIILADRLTQLEAKFGSLFKITSGLRDIQDQYRIYAAKGISNPPLGSQHLHGAAADIYDAHQTLQAFCLSEKGLEALEDIGLWCEDFSATSGKFPWVHYQIYQPKSGKRFFLP